MGPVKTKRRARVAAEHDIVMLVGDSMHDFDGVFADASLDAQRATVEHMKNAFGTRFFAVQRHLRLMEQDTIAGGRQRFTVTIVRQRIAKPSYAR